MTRLDMVREAVKEVGERPAIELCAFVARRFGVSIEPKFIPIFRATLRDREQLETARAACASASLAAPPEPGAHDLSARGREARALALELMSRHGLIGWRFAFNRRKQAMGMCFYHRRTIELSVHFVERNGREEVVDTILHEIAHALVGPGHGHDRTWKRKCVEIGARPTRCGHAEMPEGQWRAHCGACGKRFHRHRKPKRMHGWFCRTCGPERGKLLWAAGEGA